MKDFEENWHDAHGTDLLVEQATAATQSGETDILAHHHTQDTEEQESQDDCELLGLWTQEEEAKTDVAVTQPSKVVPLPHISGPRSSHPKQENPG